MREALKVYAEAAKVALSTAPSVDVLSDLGELGCDDNGTEIELDLTILQGTLASAAPLPYHIGFGLWDTESERQAFVPFIGLEKGKPLPTVGVAHGRKTTMKLVPGNENTVLKIPVYQAGSYTVNSPASLYEYVGDALRHILSARKSTEEIREAEGLLG